MVEPTGYEKALEETRRQYARATPRARRYAICMSLNMTKLSVEFNRLKRLGVPAKVLDRWKARSRMLLDEILEVSDPLESESPDED